jgi:hypothetical protein
MRRIVPLLVLAALLAPAAVAGAQAEEVKGPVMLAAQGQIAGEVSVPEDGAVRFVVAGGYVGVEGARGALEIGCRGGEMRTRRDREGNLQAACHGRRLLVLVGGDEFTFKAAGRRIGTFLPAGATATIRGEFRKCSRAGRPDAGGAGSEGRGGARGDRQRGAGRRAVAAGCRSGIGERPGRGDPAAGGERDEVEGEESADDFDPDVDGDGDVDTEDISAFLGK